MAAAIPFRFASVLGCLLLLGQPSSAGTTTRVSVDSTGSQAIGGDSGAPAISADGRFIAFHSDATNLVTGDTNGHRDVFVHDRLTGTTERVSVGSSGVQANGDSYRSAINANGRFVAFASGATNLVADDTNGALDVFVHDRQTGTTERVSVDSSGTQANDHSYSPAISADSRFVAFASASDNLSTDGAFGGVFLHDRQDTTTTHITVGNLSGFQYFAVSISGDGRSVGYKVRNCIGRCFEGIAVYDRLTKTTEEIAGCRSVICQTAHTSISVDGRFVAFDILENLSLWNSFVRDRHDGSTEQVSVDSSGREGNLGSKSPVISADGRFVPFLSSADNLVAGDTNDLDDIFVHDRMSGMTERVSVDSTGRQATGGDSGVVSVSANGRFVAFESYATDLVADDTNGKRDIFVRDREPHNDLLISLRGSGMWLFLSNGTWRRVHNVPSATIGSGNLNGSITDEAIVSFSAAGLWARYGDATWAKLHNGRPKRFIAGDLDGNGEDDLVADFGPAGLWARRNNAGWTKLHNGTSQDFAVGDFDGNGSEELIVDFGAAGLWVRYNDTAWVKRNNMSPRHMAVGDLDGNGQEELIADFGGAGLWVRYNDANWTKVHNATTQGLASGDLDDNGQEELIADFGGAGLWVRYNNVIWAKRHPGSPMQMLAADLDGGGMAELVADFGGAGLWVRYNNMVWKKIHPASPQSIVAGGLD